MLSAEQAYRHHCSNAGSRQLRKRLQQARVLRERLSAAGIPFLINDDPLRLLLHTGAWGCSGAEADAWLLERGVIAECPELLSLNFCLGLGPTRGLGRQLRQKLQQLLQAKGCSAAATSRRLVDQPLGPLSKAGLVAAIRSGAVGPGQWAHCR